MARYDLYILNSSSAVVAAMPDAVWEISETLNVEDTLRAVLFEADKFTLVTAENTFIQLINPADSTDKRTGENRWAAYPQMRGGAYMV